MHHLFDVMPGDTGTKGTGAPLVRVGFTPK